MNDFIFIFKTHLGTMPFKIYDFLNIRDQVHLSSS